MVFSASRPHKPSTHLTTKIPEADSKSIMNRAGLGVISRELVDQSAVQGCCFDSGTREARAPTPRIGFNAGNAALGTNDPQNGNWTWLRTLRHGLVRVVLLLAPYLPSLMPGRWPCGLWARWVGALVKVAVSLPVLCAHVRRETLPPTQLGMAYAPLKGGLKKPV